MFLCVCVCYLSLVSFFPNIVCLKLCVCVVVALDVTRKSCARQERNNLFIICSLYVCLFIYVVNCIYVMHVDMCVCMHLFRVLYVMYVFVCVFVRLIIDIFIRCYVCKSCARQKRINLFIICSLYVLTYAFVQVRCYILQIPTYLHTYIPTYLHTDIPTCLHTYIPTHPPTYLPAYLPTYLHTYKAAPGKSLKSFAPDVKAAGAGLEQLQHA